MDLREWRVDMNTIQLRKIETVFQPMWNLDRSTIFGYEALLRFTDGFYDGNIERAFDLARENGVIFELDTMAITNSVSSFPKQLLRSEMLLFINVYSSTLLHPQFENFINQLMNKFPQVQGKLVFELNETEKEEASWSIPELKEKITLLKEKGFLVALDDVGKGIAGLNKIIEFAPNYIKLDRYFSMGLSQSKEKQQIISLLIQYANGKMGLILEGIEEEVDLEQAKILNVPVVQGYLLGKPEKLTAQNIIRIYGALMG
jgi:EAL domain-containing protein (putative c-di-GMP-specific phosphodiesterase class I)